MMKKVTYLFLIATLIFSCQNPENLYPDVVEDKSALANYNHSGSLIPIQTPIVKDSSFVELGKKLFFEKTLSGNGSISCASCHLPEKGGADGQEVAIGIHGKFGFFNTPSIYNSSLNFLFFWDGRSASLEEQIPGPITNKLEMGGDWDSIVNRLERDPYYQKAFAILYDAEIDEQSVVHALKSYIQTLITPSRFDDYLLGKQSLNQHEIRGYQLFTQVGCASCHQGANIGGNMLQRFGITENYYSKQRRMRLADFGRYNLTQREEDKFVFKVPSLRNVALTAPYFHDGSVEKLEDAVRIMARYQLGQELQEDEIHDIVAFLHSLNGKTLEYE